MLVEQRKDIGFVAGTQDFAAADADLENGGAAGNRGGIVMNVMTPVRCGPRGPAREIADGLDAVLRLPAMRMTAS